MTTLAQFFCDYYERKAFKQVLQAEPHAIYFLGDLFWGTHFFSSKEEYQKSWDRYNWIFENRKDIKISEETKNKRNFIFKEMKNKKIINEKKYNQIDVDFNIPYLNLTGNHDMGMYTGKN